MYKEIAALIIKGKFDEIVVSLKIELEKQLPSHQKVSSDALLKQLGTYLMQTNKREPITKRWRVECFNQVRFICHHKEIQNIHWRRKKAKELFVFLLLQPNYRATKNIVSEKLFYCDDFTQISNQLYVIIHHIKRMLLEYLHIDNGIAIKNGIIQLNEEMIDHVDTEKYTTLVRVGNQLWATYPDLSVELFDEAQQLFGEVVPNLQYLDWLDEYRKDLQQKQIGIVKRLAFYYESLAQLEKAEYYFLEWVALAPYEEEAYQELMKMYMKMKQFSSAERWYYKMEQLFYDELDLAPSSETLKIITERFQ